MFVGGPNTRTDFHLDLGSEFFFQFSGNMELPTVQRGVRKLVKIREGDVFLLPSRIPHSPQRPEEGYVFWTCARGVAVAHAVGPYQVVRARN